MLVDLGEGPGSEPKGARPALVVSNDGFNRLFPLATVLPLTKLQRKRRGVYAFEVVLPAGAAGNEVDSLVMPHQIRTVSRQRLMHRIGHLTAPKLRMDIESRMLDHLGVGFDDDHE